MTEAEAAAAATERLIERAAPRGVATDVALYRSAESPTRGELAIDTASGAFTVTLDVAIIAKLTAGLPQLLRDVAD